MAESGPSICLRQFSLAQGSNNGSRAVMGFKVATFWSLTRTRKRPPETHEIRSYGNVCDFELTD